MSGNLESSFDSMGVDTSKTLLASILTTTLYNSARALPEHVPESRGYVSSDTINVSSDSKTINGFNLGVSLVKKNFDGFVGLAKILAPSDKEISILRHTLVEGKLVPQKDSYTCVMPRIYDCQEHISLEKLYQINP
jgi:hypothetical protein